MAHLEILEGPFQGTRIQIEEKLTIGRHTGNGLCLSDNSVSRFHAEICHKNRCYTLIDLGSANGTILNNDPLHKLVPRQLYNSDQIVIGANRIVFHAEDQENPIKKGLQKSSNLLRNTTSLSIIMTSDEVHPRVNATFDAAHSFTETTSEQNPEILKESVKRLQAMVKISKDLAAIFKPELLAERIMSVIFDILPFADRAFIMLKDPQSSELIPVRGKKRNVADSTEEFAVSKTIVKTVLDQKQAILSSDVRHDLRFAESQSIVNLSIRSFMCTPFICKDEILGVLCVDSISRQDAFTTDDLEMLTGIASQAAVALKNASLFSTIEKESRIRTQLSRYLSKDVVEGILDGSISLQLGGEKKKGTILFCDIVGFTSIAENLSANDVVVKLNSYFSIVTEIVTRNCGTLHKFGGDMVMAFWNVMVRDLNAEENAVRTGLEMQNAVYIFNLDIENEGQRPVFLGIGCNTGEFAGGNIGGTDRMEYTVIGDNVNLAQRIESLACRWQVLITSETYAPIKDKCIAIQLPQAVVKGRIQPITIYSVRGMALDDSSLILNIPVVIMTPDGNVVGNGLVTKFRIVCEESELQISTIASIPPWTSLLLQFDLPELPSAPHLRGKVTATYRDAHDGKTVYSKIALTNLTGDDALVFFKKGTLIESRKNWNDMRRH